MSHLALFGGTPQRTKPFPSWPVVDETEAQAVLQVLILARFQDETKNDTIAACQDHDTSIGNSSRKREPSLPKPPISDS